MYYWLIFLQVRLVLYTENYKKLMKKLKKTNRKVKHVHGLEELILLKCYIRTTQSDLFGCGGACL